MRLSPLLVLVLVRRIVLSRAPDAAHSLSRQYVGRGGPAGPAAGKKGAGGGEMELLQVAAVA